MDTDLLSSAKGDASLSNAPTDFMAPDSLYFCSVPKIYCLLEGIKSVTPVPIGNQLISIHGKTASVQMDDGAFQRYVDVDVVGHFSPPVDCDVRLSVILKLSLWMSRQSSFGSDDPTFHIGGFPCRQRYRGQNGLDLSLDRVRMRFGTFLTHVPVLRGDWAATRPSF